MNIRERLEKLGHVTRYLTENMLQACEEFAQEQSIWPFVDNNTDAVVEVARQGVKTLVGIEFENSEKAQERYVRKLVKYYSDGRTPAIFYICSSERIREAVSQAEGALVGKSSPRCFYALLSDVLRDSADCTFVDRNGARIVLR